jgi:hypothetical protein
MLKPKRKITKKELKKDPFLEFINDAQNWFSDRKKLIYRVVIGLVAITVILYVIGKSRSTSNYEAETLLGKAMLSQDLGDTENFRFQLQSLVDDYSGTQAGKQGSYYFGKLLYDEANFSSAEIYLKSYVKKGNIPELLTASYKMLASIAHINKDNELAEEYYSLGAEVSHDTVYENEMELLYANQLNINGKSNRALKIVNNILEKDDLLLSTEKAAQELKGKIEG